MKDIKKGNEPESLRAYRLGARGRTYEDFRDKKDLRAALLKEQGSVCAYCTGRIRSETMKIEHWSPRALHPERQLDWRNLLGVCEGGQGRPRKLRYLSTGEICAVDGRFIDRELARLRGPNKADGRVLPYAQLAIHVLEKRRERTT